MTPGTDVEVTISNLDLTSLGSPENTTLTASLSNGTDEVDLGEVPVSDGSATLVLAAPAGVGTWVLTAVAQESGTTVTVPVTVAKASSKTTAKVTPKKVVAKKTKAKVKVTVKSAGANASGKVRVKAGGKSYTATLKNGKATVKLKPFKKAGKQKVTVRYLGNASAKASTTKVTVKVAKPKKNKKK